MTKQQFAAHIVTFILVPNASCKVTAIMCKKCTIATNQYIKPQLQKIFPMVSNTQCLKRTIDQDINIFNQPEPTPALKLTQTLIDFIADYPEVQI